MAKCKARRRQSNPQQSHYETYRSLLPAPVDKYGICIPFEGLDLMETQLEGRDYVENNHHYAYEKRTMGKLAIYQTFRDLDCMQTQQPIDVHAQFHSLYGQPELIKPVQALDKIMEQFAIGGLLRIGSARNPEYKPLTDNKIIQLKDEYNRIRHML